MASTNRMIAKGAAWMLSARITDRALGLVSTLFLARLLVPADFGLMAIATSVLVLLQLFASFGFDVVLIQHSSPTRGHYDTVWTLEILFSAMIALVLVALAYPAARFYDEPRLVGVMLVLALTALVRAFGNVGCVDFRRELRFDIEFRLRLYSRLITLPTTVGLAFLLQNYWALVLGTLISTVLGVGVSYWMHPYRPRLSMERTGELFNFSKWLFLNNMLIFVNFRAADFIIGKLLGTRSLGLYGMANEFGSLPAAELIAPINRAAFPGYARLAHNWEELIRTYLKVIAGVALIVLPAAVGIALTAHRFVPLLLGPKWVEIIQLLVLLALASALFGLWSNTSYIFLAIGEPRRATGLIFFQAVATVLSLVGFLLANVSNGPGWAMLLTGSLMAVPNLYLWKTQLHIPWSRALSAVWRPAMACGLMALVVMGVDAVFIQATGLVAEATALAAAILGGATTYVLAVLTLWRFSGSPDGAESFLVDQVYAAVRRWRRGA